MHIHRVKSKQGNKVYVQILLRESYRETVDGKSKVKKRTLLNLTKYPENVIKAIELALKHKEDLPDLEQLLNAKVTQRQGRAVGALWILHRISKETGIDKVLGKSKNGLLCLWMVMARLIDQGSRLSAVRLAEEHAVCEILGLDDFSEDDLYDALDWLSENQDKLEKRLFKQTYGNETPTMFLYDVTSSYLEGQKNELGEWGYNRDKKRGKRQIVIGLLCADDGSPVSVRVFKGNTTDLQTFSAQIEKTADEFGCKQVTMVGDRGMIKSAQIEELGSAGFHYITAITKPQIRLMLKKGVFQLGLFDSELCEIQSDGCRYILRRNPLRAAEMAGSRRRRIDSVKAFADEKSRYLAEHPRADAFKAIKKVWEKEERLGVGDFLEITCGDERIIKVVVDEQYVSEVAELDGCYVIKTDLPTEAASKETVHDRYKDLSLVESAFRTMKTGHLEVRPIYVRKESRTRGHVFIVMLSYILRRRLASAWRAIDIKVEEGLKQLSSLCAVETEIDGSPSGSLSVPKPREGMSLLFESLAITPPVALP
ncbi:MAG: IS1634 family transposase, partial [Desulfocapsaceae bacterium]